MDNKPEILDVHIPCATCGKLIPAGGNNKCLTCRLMDVAMDHALQTWIPVTERLPKSIANKVIVRCKNDYIGFGHYEDYKGKQTWYNLESDKPFTDWDLEDCESYEVTHWMPLPEPPKGE